MRLGGARQRQNPLYLGLDFALHRGGETLRHVGGVIAGLTLDGDAFVIEVREVDRDVRPRMAPAVTSRPSKPMARKAFGSTFGLAMLS